MHTITQQVLDLCSDPTLRKLLTVVIEEEIARQRDVTEEVRNEYNKMSAAVVELTQKVVELDKKLQEAGKTTAPPKDSTRSGGPDRYPCRIEITEDGLSNKMGTIKEVRESLGLGLGEAKTVVEHAMTQGNGKWVSNAEDARGHWYLTYLAMTQTRKYIRILEVK